MKSKTTKKPKEPFFKTGVAVWFYFYEQKFGYKPTFDTSAPRDLKLISESLRQRAESKGHEWTEELYRSRLIGFLNFAFTDRWMAEHFTLRLLNSQKDCIYAKLRNSIEPNRVINWLAQ